MKRLLSFGFIPVSQSSQGSVEKRAKYSDSGTDPPQPSEDQPELPQSPQSMPPEPQQLLQSPEPLQVPSKFVRNDVGTYSSDRLRRLSDEDRLWLLCNAFLPYSSFKYPTKEEYGKKRAFQ